MIPVIALSETIKLYLVCFCVCVCDASYLINYQSNISSRKSKWISKFEQCQNLIKQVQKYCIRKNEFFYSNFFFF